MVMPMTRSPARSRSPATTELSTPPDMATATVYSDIGWRQFSQARHHLDHRLDQQFDLLSRIRASQRKTYARSRLYAAESDCRQHVGGLGGAARTSRAARYRETFEVERDQQRLTINAIETDVRGIRHPRRACAVDVCIRDLLQN